MTSRVQVRVLSFAALLAAPLATGCGGEMAAPPPVSGVGGQGGVEAIPVDHPGTGGSPPGSGGGVGPVSGSGTGGGSPPSTPVATGGSPASSGGSMANGGRGAGGGPAVSRDGGMDARTDGGNGAAAGRAGSVGIDGGVASDASAPREAGALPPPPPGKITVWLAGDSTMQTCKSACPCGWGGQFQPFFGANATVVNNAVSGRSIQTWLYDPNVTTVAGADGECVISPKTYSTRWQAMLDPTTGMKAGDYLLIEFGINDGDPNCASGRHVGLALFQSYLGVMAQAAKDRGAHAIFLTSTSFMQCTGSSVLPDRGFGPQTRAAGLANDVPVIDLTQLSASLYTSLGLCPNDGNFMSTTTPVGKFFCDDHTHFETPGAAQIAAVVAKALRDQSIPLASYLQ